MLPPTEWIDDSISTTPGQASLPHVNMKLAGQLVVSVLVAVAATPFITAEVITGSEDVSQGYPHLHLPFLNNSISLHRTRWLDA